MHNLIKIAHKNKNVSNKCLILTKKRHGYNNP